MWIDALQHESIKVREMKKIHAIMHALFIIADFSIRQIQEFKQFFLPQFGDGIHVHQPTHNNYSAFLAFSAYNTEHNITYVFYLIF